jgi:hypothetical protein
MSAGWTLFCSNLSSADPKRQDDRMVYILSPPSPMPPIHHSQEHPERDTVLRPLQQTSSNSSYREYGLEVTSCASWVDVSHFVWEDQFNFSSGHTDDTITFANNTDDNETELELVGSSTSSYVPRIAPKPSLAPWPADGVDPMDNFATAFTTADQLR